MKTKITCILFLAVLFLSLSSGLSSAEEVYHRISETELTQLEQNLAEQENQLILALEELKLLKLDSTEANEQLITAKNELNQSRIELKALREDLQKASASIEKANQLFNEYEKEAKRTQSRLTRQRNTVIVAGGLIIAFPIIELIRKSVD
jgi:chromosome segregation ATPase